MNIGVIVGWGIGIAVTAYICYVLYLKAREMTETFMKKKERRNKPPFDWRKIK